MNRTYSLAEPDLGDPRPYRAPRPGTAPRPGDGPWPGDAPWPGEAPRPGDGHDAQFGDGHPSDGLSRVSLRPEGGDLSSAAGRSRRRAAGEKRRPGRRRPGSSGPGGRRPDGPDGTGDGTPPGRSRRRKILQWTSLITTLVLVAASLAAYAAYRNVVGGIRQVDVTHLLGKRPPQYSTAAMNILVIGSDSRAGTNGQFGSAQAISGARSDTMMLLHILPERRGGVVISFPRDSLVPIIGCQTDGLGDPGQKAQPGQTEMLNATFANGGAACLWKTLETSTGIFIDHFVEINFNGFQSVVNDLGGVNVCLPEAVNDPASGLDLSAGTHHVNGAQALAFVRERHIGEGSDLQRIQRQQFFMAALLQQIGDQKTLSDVPRLYTIARDVARTLTTDSGLSVGTMLSVADGMKGSTSKGVQFTQVPVIADPNDANRVRWQQPQAAQLFSAVARDQSVAKPAKTSGATPKASASRSATSADSPAQVAVKVLNATAAAGLAAQAAASLSQSHYDVLGTGNAVAPSASTIIQYSSPAGAAAAKALAQVIPDAQIQQVAGVTGGTVDLILGSSFTGVKTASASSSSTAISNVTETYGGITGNTNICSDSGAFTGPDVPADFAP
jgi:LCP family protein required for cell wall assembly